MNTINATQNDYRHRKRKAAQLPYYRVQYDLPLGDTPSVRTCLESNGLWELVTAPLREVYYYKVYENQKRKNFCAIGWPNENGGWEIRHPRYIGCIGLKGMTFIAGKPDRLLVFIDLTDYLCWQYDHKNDFPSILILNHLEFLPAARKRAAKFVSVTVGFDRIPQNLFTNGV
ncbi:hypothetical protein [Mucilaginibacter paludis]|uniref:Uncharacterized protein n=1 Tax=Mucilaginibacter paludis DSM 18603 TaxID=714943 RepID=H1YHM8_9SPHI|nr:hypothetical protein [Mucilaginibacter paludis]EHQ26451.1 hypothetical protein Mucpa_2321 [Mucilaginibacter paludis DSM 18603]